MTPARVAPREVSSRADLCSLEERDLPALAHFIASQSGRDRDAVEAHLRWFLLENPVVRLAQVPLGFGLRSGGKLVGCILCVPQEFAFQQEKIIFVGSSSFYVDESHRGQGGRIFLHYSRLAREWPLFGTSANAEAARLWQAVGATSIADSDCELFGVLRWPRVLEEVVHRKSRHPRLTKLAGSRIIERVAGRLRQLNLERIDGGTLRRIESPEEIKELPIYTAPDKLTCFRSTAYLRWRYFSPRDTTTALFAFRSGPSAHETLVAVNERMRGYRGQIRTLNVLDVCREASSDEWIRITGSLAERYCDAVDAIVVRGVSAQTQKALCDRGFQRRQFDAPIGWYFDKSKRLPAQDRCYFVPADGDGLI